jgi:hypothetical protein
MTGFLEGLREVLRQVETVLLNTHNKLLHERVLDARLRCDRLIEESK